jgi:hypothetical protein
MNGNNYLFISTIHEQRLADVERMAGAYPLPRLGGIGKALGRVGRTVRRLTAQGLRGSAALLGWLANRLDAGAPHALG